MKDRMTDADADLCRRGEDTARRSPAWQLFLGVARLVRKDVNVSSSGTVTDESR